MRKKSPTLVPTIDELRANPRKLYDIWNAAAFFQVDIRTVANYRLTGRLKAEKVNEKKYLFRGEDLLNTLERVDDHYYDA